MPKIAVIGDAMHDIDIELSFVKTMDWMPVYREQSKTERLGGSLNVERMCQSLGAKIISMSGHISIKTRYFLDSQAWRVDDDSEDDLHPLRAKEWRRELKAKRPDIILVCDHGKGVVNRHLMDAIKHLGIPIYVDPCLKSDWSLFEGVACVSANQAEWASCGEHWYDKISDSSEMLIRRADVNGVFYRDGDQLLHIPSICRSPVDTVGAGDQFIAVLACLRADGASWEESIIQANTAAGIQCERKGIVPVTMEELRPEKKLELAG